MKFTSIKYKITLWYTSIIIIVFGIVLGASFFYTEYYGENEIKTELLDEIKDLREDVIKYSGYLSQAEMASYYDDGIMLSIYNSDYELINGVVPDDFPADIVFDENGIKTVKSEEENWFVSDSKVVVPDAGELWIRGIHSYSSILGMIRRLTVIMCVVFPILILFTAFTGFRMIRRCLVPVETITDTADEITHGSELSRRLPLPESKDELYHLCDTFNRMFERLEDAFLMERQFSSDAAHELRTPIAVILSHCEYCLEELSLEPEIKKEVTIVKQKAQHISELITQLLAISRVEKQSLSPEYELIDLQLLAESVTEELGEKAAEKNIQIEIVNEMKTPEIQGDMSMLTRLFINLTDNAIVYGKENGHITISLTNKEDRVCLVFEDDGIGISKEQQKLIWNRFYQADSSRSDSKGFGLGLFMVRQIVECHKGSIFVDSELGKGSRFVVELPVTKG